MSSVEEQTRIATDFLKNLGRGGIDRKYYADDMTCWSSLMGTVKLEDYLPKLDSVKAVFKKPLEIMVDSTTAQPGRIVLQVRSWGVLFNDDIYDNEYLFLFEFNERDQIRHIREYFNMDKTRDILIPAIAEWKAAHPNNV